MIIIMREAGAYGLTAAHQPGRNKNAISSYPSSSVAYSIYILTVYEDKQFKKYAMETGCCLPKF